MDLENWGKWVIYFGCMNSLSEHVGGGGGGSVEAPLTRGELVSVLDEVRMVEEEAAAVFLGIDNVWQALVFVVLGYVLIDRLWTHFVGDKKTKEIERAINGFGVDKDGKKITMAAFARQQMRIQKENRALLIRICRSMGIKRDEM